MSLLVIEGRPSREYYITEKPRWPARVPSIMNELKSRFIAELCERIERAIADVTGKAVIGTILEKTDVEFGETYMELTIYVDLDNEKYLNMYFELCQIASRELINLYYEFKERPVTLFIEDLYTLFEPPSVIRKALDDLVSKLSVEILPMR